MQFLDSHTATALALFDFIRDHGAALPAETYAALARAAAQGSNVVRVVEACEALYAAGDELPAEGHVLCAQLARFAEDHDFNSMAATGRAGALIRASRRRMGEIDAAAAPPSQDPEPRDHYLTAAVKARREADNLAAAAAKAEAAANAAETKAAKRKG